MFIYVIVLTMMVNGAPMEFIGQRHYGTLSECNGEMLRAATTAMSSNWVATCRQDRVV